MASAQSSTCGATVTVQLGDSLAALSKRCHVQLCSMYIANQAVIGVSARVLVPGQILTVPPPPTTLVVYDHNCRVMASATQNDIATLNYALTLEHLEAAFYNEYQAQFSDANFSAAGLPVGTYAYLNVVQAHENAHVAALNKTITSLGGTPVAACTYDFSAVTDVKTYLAYARVFENTGASAYDGAINTLSDNTLQEVAATIATVEARHAAFFNQLNHVNPFPNVTDPALSPNAVVTAVTPFIKSCDGPALTLPVVRTATANYNASAANASALAMNDINTLNYALTLEHLEAYYYNYYASNFTVAQYAAAGYPGAQPYIELITQHEGAHVALLTAVIQSLGGTPVPPCMYNFTMAVGNGTNITAFLLTARALENTGVSAYDGAVNTLSNPALQEAAATIATVEARHASYLNGLTGNIPFPDVLDTAHSPAQTIGIAGAFIVSCPYTIPQPSAQATPVNKVTITSDASTPSVLTSSGLLIAAGVVILTAIAYLPRRKL